MGILPKDYLTSPPLPPASAGTPPHLGPPPPPHSSGSPPPPLQSAAAGPPGVNAGVPPLGPHGLGPNHHPDLMDPRTESGHNNGGISGGPGMNFGPNGDFDVLHPPLGGPPIIVPPGSGGLPPNAMKMEPPSGAGPPPLPPPPHHIEPWSPSMTKSSLQLSSNVCMPPLHSSSGVGGASTPPLQSKEGVQRGGGGGEQPPLCAGCRLRIVDKFYLCAVESKWHTSCLKCAECGVQLENQVSCFERDGHMYCKEDYVRIFTSKCFRCMMKLSSSDLVMKVRQCLFHVDCFRCATCDASLKKGDLFGLLDDVPYCRTHYELLMGSGSAAGAGAAPPSSSSTIPPPPGSFTSSEHMSHSPVDGGGENFPPPPPPGLHPLGFPPSFVGPPGSEGGPPPGWFPGCPPGVAGDFPGVGGEFGGYDNNNEPRLKKQRGRKKRKVETFAAMNGYLEAAGGYPPGVDGPNGSKTKRARTSFKHHQLRIMKAHFQINQNPDSRELKMLSQKTQLDKKVLQVWFQNARAKWRRTKAQDPPGSVNGGGGSGSVGMGGMGGPPAPPGTIPPAPNSSSSGMSGPEDAELAGASPCSDSSGAMIPCC